MKILETERLILRTWESEDAGAYFEINQDPKVTEFVRGPLSMEEAHRFIERVNANADKYGYSLWAVELKKTGALMGFVGLDYVDWESCFTPAVEVGWRLGLQYWGHGFATEGARASLDYGFNACGLKEIVSFTTPSNIRSIRVMEKLGLKHDVHGDFVHPELDADHPASHHILYRLSASDYFKEKSGKKL